MPYSGTTYTPPTGATNATAGVVIRSATWNTIFTDLSTALTQVALNTFNLSKASVAVATIGSNITLSGEQTIDGVLTSASRILVKDQTTASANGIYVTNASAWTRATDFNTTGQVVTGTRVLVTGGTYNINTTWSVTSTGTLTIGSSSIDFNGGLVDTEMFVTSLSDFTLTNSVATAQAIFTSANATLALKGSTTYFFEGQLQFSTGTVTHTTALGFATTSAVTSSAYLAELWSTTSGTISTTAPSFLNVTSTSATTLNATSAATFTTIRVRGNIRTNAATAITPQITFGAGPTGTCVTKADSYLRIWPVGSSTVVASGTWT